MGERLHIDLLGTFQLRYNEKPVPDMSSPRLQELLSYLILHRDAPQLRQQIALNFWPENPEKQTLANLRQLLYQLRNALPESDNYIYTDSTSIQWKEGARCRIDVIAFEQFLVNAREARENSDTESEIDFLQKAVPLYRGPLLPYCFEEWITGERNRLQEAYTNALERLADVLEEERNYEAAITYAGKLLKHDPCSESACRRMLQLHALNEDRASVIRTYRAFKKKIWEELEIEPGSKTKELYKRLSESFRGDSGDSTAASVLPPGNGLDAGWPMVGRLEEWKMLLEAWNGTRSGIMHWVLIRGETGIGKSRLGRELLAYLCSQGFAGARARCYKAPGTPGYGPLAEWLRSPPFNSRIEGLDGFWLGELSRLLPEFTARQQNAPASGPWQQRHFEEALAHALLAGGKPMLLLLEEVQWCDPETLGWFEFILNRSESTPLLVAATLRTTAGNPYAGEALEGLLNELRMKHRLHVIEPSFLDQSETLELASRILKRELSESMGALIYRETEGNPLFIVETARELHLLKQLKEKHEDEFIPPDKTASQVRDLPRVVSDVIAGRFRYLTPKSREVLGIAAAAGRDFSFDLIARTGDIKEVELVEALEELIRQYILREKRSEIYDFTHDKLREVAYKQLSVPRRRLLHRNIAAAIQHIYKDNLPPCYARLAFHCERAGKTEDALAHYQKAALHARNVTSLQDIGMLRHALELLSTLPESTERKRREFYLTASLTLSLLQRRTFDTEEVFRLGEKVYKLGSELGEPPPVAVLFTTGMASLISGNPETAIELGTVMHSMARETDDSKAGVESCYLLGISTRIAGRISESVRWFREALERVDGKQKLAHIQIYDLDGRIILEMEAAGSMLLAGHKEEAEKRLETEKKHARAAGQSLGAAFMCYAEAWHYVLLRDEKKAREAAEQFGEINTPAAPMHWAPQVDILLGWSMAAATYFERGIERIQKGIDRLEELNYRLELPFNHVLLAESLTAAGKYFEAQTAIDRARESMHRTGSRFAEAECFRIEGELLLAQEPADTKSARRVFEKAIATARKQGAGLFEKRAAAALEKAG